MRRSDNSIVPARRPHGRCVHALFEAQAALTPEAVAVVCQGQHLTYAALDARANQVAHHLIGLGVGPEVLVGVCLERSLDLVVALLGVLKAGGAYVPLDPGYPQARLAFMLNDTHAPVVLTQQSLIGSLPASPSRVVCLDGERADLASRPSTPVGPRATPANLAYVIYTSGSTGQPKGVCIEHHGLSHYLAWAIDAYGVTSRTTSPVHSSVAFDLTVTSLYCPLLAGGVVHLLPEHGGIQALADALLQSEARFDVVKITPAHLAVLTQLVPAAQAAHLARVFVVGGEQLHAESIAYWRTHAPATVIVNEYGPTETVVGCCVHFVTAESPQRGPIPIGRAIDRTQLHILDPDGAPVAAGQTGELYIGGQGVGRGYLQRPELTAERFLPDPFSAAPGARLYRTGDLARHLDDGQIEFLGRVDQQVKVRGFRIELAEIEAVLAEHPEVRHAAATVRRAANGSAQLVGAVVPLAADAPDLPRRLLRWAAERLPSYMVPAAIVAVRELPLTPNGKVDVEALRRLAPEHAAVEDDASLTPLETGLLGIWRDVLCEPALTPADDFFAFGGDSMAAIRMLTRLESEYGIHLPPRALFLGPTVRGLARVAADPALLAPAHDAGFVVLGAERPGRPVHCIPGVAGTTYQFQALASRLRAVRPVVAIELHDLDVPPEVLESVPETAAAIARGIVRLQPQGPYTLLGYSFGGHVAFEVARALTAGGHTVENTVILDTYAPGALRHLTGMKKVREHLRQLVRLSPDAALDYVVSRTARRLRPLLPGADGDDDVDANLHIAEVERRIHDAADRCLRAVAAYRPGPYAGVLRIIRATDLNEWSEAVDTTGTLGWSHVCSGPIDIIALKCRHSDVFREPFIGDVARQLECPSEPGERRLPRSA